MSTRGSVPPMRTCTGTRPGTRGYPGHSRAHTSTPMYGHRETGAAGVSLHTLTSTHALTLGVSQPGPALRWPSSQQRNADSWGASASGREGEAPGKPHGQQSRQACQAEAGPSGARNCAGGHAQILAYSHLSHQPVSSEPLGHEGQGVSQTIVLPQGSEQFLPAQPCWVAGP